jgi:hypothetical protein
MLALGTVDDLIGAHGGKTVIVADMRGGQVRIETSEPLRELGKLHESGQLLRLRVDRPDLEGVFLNLTGRHLQDN